MQSGSKSRKGTTKNRFKQQLFASIVIVKHCFVDACLICYFLHAGTILTFLLKDILCGIQNLLFGILTCLFRHCYQLKGLTTEFNHLVNKGTEFMELTK